MANAREQTQWWARAQCKDTAPRMDTVEMAHSREPLALLRSRAIRETRTYAPQLKTCWQCPVRSQCLADAKAYELRNRPRGGHTAICYGIRGGMPPSERVLHWQHDTERSSNA